MASVQAESMENTCKLYVKYHLPTTVNQTKSAHATSRCTTNHMKRFLYLSEYSPKQTLLDKESLI